MQVTDGSDRIVSPENECTHDELKQIRDWEKR